MASIAAVFRTHDDSGGNTRIRALISETSQRCQSFRTFDECLYTRYLVAKLTTMSITDTALRALRCQVELIALKGSLTRWRASNVDQGSDFVPCEEFHELVNRMVRMAY